MMSTDPEDQRVDGRGVSRGVVDVYDRMETASTSASTLKPRPDPSQPIMPIGGATVDSTDPERRRLAAEFLTRARDDFERATRTRIAYTIAARRHGLTNADIGALLGITEGAVRGIVARHGGDA